MQIREYHRKHPAARVVDANEEYEGLLKEEPMIEFSGEVSFALYFSLYTAYLTKCLIVVQHIEFPKACVLPVCQDQPINL
jgi:hypothetical protein